MHVLIVVDHPDPNSFTMASVAQFADGVASAGHDFELADLHKEGFDPRYRMADARGGNELAADIVKEQERINRADAICFAFPLFWWGMPAMTKGWIDRVWSWGWAYEQLDDPEKSLQRKRPGMLLIPAGARSDTIIGDGYGAALETAWMKGTFGYFGFSPRRIEFLYGSTGSVERRVALLERAFDLGLGFLGPAD